MNVQLNTSGCKNFVDKAEFARKLDQAKESKKSLLHKTGKGNDFLGWLDLPSFYTQEDLIKIAKSAQRLQKQSKLVVVIGIGGSYLGARAVIEALKEPFTNNSDSPEIVFAGHHLDSQYHNNLLNYARTTDFSVIVISKSGTTTEPAIAFRMFKMLLEEKYGKDEAKKRIIAITDKQKGALHSLANKEGYESYIIPDDVGGRFSVLSPVGLLPLAVAGVNIEELLLGAKDFLDDFVQDDSSDHIVLQYAALRNLLYVKGYKTELLSTFWPQFNYLAEWWKQLYGESEGKDHKGIFPASAGFTTDLHSLGQYIQDGERQLIETVLAVTHSKSSLKVPFDNENLDGLNYLSGKELHFVNQKAEEGTILAHIEGGVPLLKIEIPEINEFNIGQFLYFFELACGVSAYILGVNPFDQPGVETYKRNMFRLLEKPGSN